MNYINKDKCVWKYEYKNQFYYKAISPHRKFDCMIDNSNKWKYCPYCGKEIEYDEGKSNTKYKNLTPLN